VKTRWLNNPEKKQLTCCYFSVLLAMALANVLAICRLQESRDKKNLQNHGSFLENWKNHGVQ